MSSSSLGDGKLVTTTVASEDGTKSVAAAPASTLPIREVQGFQAALSDIFVRAGKPAPTAKQLEVAAAALPSEAHDRYLAHLQAKIARVHHPGVLETDVPAYTSGWPVEKERLSRLQAETEGTRHGEHEREQTEAAERLRWVKEELLADRYADPEEVKCVLEQYPDLRSYTPPPEHMRARDIRHVWHALNEIRRANCPPQIKEEQRHRLAELEQISPGIVDEVKREGKAN